MCEDVSTRTRFRSAESSNFLCFQLCDEVSVQLATLNGPSGGMSGEGTGVVSSSQFFLGPKIFWKHPLPLHKYSRTSELFK